MPDIPIANDNAANELPTLADPNGPTHLLSMFSPQTLADELIKRGWRGLLFLTDEPLDYVSGIEMINLDESNTK